MKFTVGGVLVHSLTATGNEQTASFTLGDGRHAVSVNATDAAGNVSRTADFNVTVDTTAPDAPRLAADVGTSAGSGTSVQLEGEAGSTFAVELAGPSAEIETGTLRNGEESFSWLLANGDYVLTARLTDDNGNESSAATETFTVALPAPNAPSLTVLSDPGADPIEIAVNAPGATSATLIVAGDDGSSSEELVDLDQRGQGTVEFSWTDGRYSVEAHAVDFQDQRSEASQLEDLIVKASLPALALTFVDNLLDTGWFAYELLAEEGSTVRILSDTEELLAEFTATGLTQEFSFEVPNGEHFITVSVVDAFGNETVEGFAAAVTSPLGVGGWTTLLFMLALLGSAGFGLRKLWRLMRSRSHRPSAPTMPAS